MHVMENKPKLYVDLIPESSFCKNLRAGLTSADWDLVRRDAYKRSNYCCEVCGGKGSKHPVEAHERWSYDQLTGIQKLETVSSLCPACHEATHMGLAKIRGRGDIAFDHLRTVNHWSIPETTAHIAEAFSIWRNRKAVNWEVDVTWLMDKKFPLSQKSLENIVEVVGGWKLVSS